MIDLYKYVYGIYETDKPVFTFSTNRETRGHSLKLSKAHCRLNIRGSYFTERVVNTWNSLPEHVVTAPSMNAFKGRLDAHWAALPTVYCPECHS